METFTVQDSDGNTALWTVADILEEINASRSPHWTPYDETDWREGWREWVEGKFYTMVDS